MYDYSKKAMQDDLNMWESWRLGLKNKVLAMQDADFEAIALDMFRFTSTYNPLYRQYIDLMQIDIQAVKTISDIPFLPIELFKNHRVLSGN
ncbi:MAG: hypothetical protein KA527_09160, partial [Cytophagaceae bacterium]|nr:hypothetical protein [Cytophagaceae bacterium]